MRKIGFFLLSVLFLTGCAAPAVERGNSVPVQPPAVTPTEVPTPAPSLTQAPPPSVTPTGEQELPVYPDPITGFFQSCRFEPGTHCTPFDSYFASLEAEAWRGEAEHAFQILRERAHPDILEVGIDLEQMERDLHSFVNAQAELYATICFTSALGEEDGAWGEQIFRGTGFSQGYEQARSALYKTVVKYFYAYGLHYPKGGETYVSDYVFDSEEILERFNAIGVTCTVVPCEIDIPPLAWTEQKTPIDAWVEGNSLYSDGSTLALSCDAHMESDIWKAELEQLYSLLQKYSDPAAGLGPVIRTAQDSFFAFVPAFGEVGSLYSHSALFVQEYWEDDVLELESFCGTIHKAERWLNQTYYYREEVLRLREALCSAIGEEKVDWAFDPEPYEAELREFYGENRGKG